jgi:squalene-hopene/tetraprenyl-beta-curcumene cyclase
LDRVQNADGSFTPLWFGNQDQAGEENPVYGTARVLQAYAPLGRGRTQAARRAVAWLVNAQHADGGWGGGAAVERTAGEGRPSSVEETALAVEALLDAEPDDRVEPAISRGLAWLVEAVEDGRFRRAEPIGFYFAKLWYYEKLYPIIYTVSALGRAIRRQPPALAHAPPASAPRTT